MPLIERKLNPKQQALADYCIELGNAEEAALKAGYSKAYARGKAYTLLANVGIKVYIDNRLEEIKSERVADQQEIMEYLTAIMRGETTSIDVVFLVKYLINKIIKVVWLWVKKMVQIKLILKLK